MSPLILGVSCALTLCTTVACVRVRCGTHDTHLTAHSHVPFVGLKPCGGETDRERS